MGRWRGSSLFFVLAIVLIAGMAAACAGAEEPTDPSDTFGSGAADSKETNDENNGENGEEGEAESLAWVPFGPSDPDSPTPSWPAYKALADGNCPGLEAYTSEQDLGDFGRAMVALCFAAVEGEQERWDELAEVADADPSTLANTCLAPFISDLIQRALQWHEQNPGETPEIQFVRLDGQTTCGEQQSAGENGTGGGETNFTEEPEESEPSPAPEVSHGDPRMLRGNRA